MLTPVQREALALIKRMTLKLDLDRGDPTSAYHSSKIKATLMLGSEEVTSSEIEIVENR